MSCSKVGGNLPYSIPAAAGIGLRSQHYWDILKQKPPVKWLEVHPENYFGDGGVPHYCLAQLRAFYPLSFHGVGLSLGSVDPLNKLYLQQLKELIERFSPALVSDHLSWSSVDQCYFNDLLPMPYTEESLRHFCLKIEQVQDFLQRQILIENPSSYLTFEHSTIDEWEYFVETAKRSGCGLLLDVNNVYVSAQNCGFDARRYIDAIPGGYVGEIHLAGFASNSIEGEEILIDNHGAAVADEVWQLYQYTLDCIGSKPSLIEWDSHLPPLSTLLLEAQKLQCLMDRSHAVTA